MQEKRRIELSPKQREIVETEDKNMLVQGVAGSGKTNVCIEKIIFSAERGYKGRLLYSTFSRGLLIDTQNKVLEISKSLADARIAAFLENNVDFKLIEDFSPNAQLADETFFVKNYIGGIKNHVLAGKLEKLKNLSYEVIYKEIYGVVLGSQKILTLPEYIEKRKSGFSRENLETIYAVARDYEAYLKAHNLTDNNLISREIMAKNYAGMPKYSLAILDEVQDMTEVNLCFVKGMSLKMFCVGDALQMVNPSYFSFAFLKRLLFEKDITPVAELAHNFRNSKKIAGILEAFSEVTKKEFGTHSFILSGEGQETGAPTSALYLTPSPVGAVIDRPQAFLEVLSENKFNNYTIITAGVKEKAELRKALPKAEILTVAEIKGLERKVVILWNVLTSHEARFKHLERISVNRKEADENSVFRYYFNLFYVGLSRGKRHVYVYEETEIPQFARFFEDNFEAADVKKAADGLALTSNIKEAEEEENAARAEEFIKFGQYENARFAINKIETLALREKLLTKADLHEKFIAHGKYREAGVRFWEAGYLPEAREQLTLAGDKQLLNLFTAATSGGEGLLNINIVDFLPDLAGNDIAKSLIFDTINKDLAELKEKQEGINTWIRKLKN